MKSGVPPPLDPGLITHLVVLAVILIRLILPVVTSVLDLILGTYAMAVLSSSLGLMEAPL